MVNTICPLAALYMGTTPSTFQPAKPSYAGRDDTLEGQRTREFMFQIVVNG